MKRIKIALILLLILPVFVNAAINDYATSLSNAQSYITKGNYKNTYQRYINCSSYVGSCDKAGFIDNITYNNSKVNSHSYLFDGVEYFTGTTSGTQVYVVTYLGDAELKPKTSKYSARSVVPLKPGVAVRGKGTYSDPWTFDPMYQVKVQTDTRYGTIEGNSSIYVARGEAATFTMSAKTGFKYINNDCDANYSNGTLTINNVKRNMTCNVVFGTGRYKIELEGATPNTIYLRYGENFYYDEDYTRVISSLDTLPTKTGYTIQGYKFKIGETEYTLVGADKKVNRQLSTVIEDDRRITPTYKINNPATPTITGGATKVYGNSDTTLTCSSSTTYASGTTKYYQFGYATSSGGNVSWQGSYSTTNTLTISKTAYRNTRYYKCRVKATGDGSTSDEIVSTQEQQVTLLNARVDLDGNTGTVSGTNPFYVSYGDTKKYAERYSASEATAPTVTKTGYTLNGWYTAATGGTKVMNANGTLVASVANWTNASSQWAITKTSATAGTNQLYAQFDANPLTFGNQTRTGTYNIATQTFSITGASNGTGSYTYTEKSEKNSAGTATSYFTLSGTTITAAANTPANTYTYVVTVKDSNSNVTKDATYTITINKKAVTVTAASQSRDYNGSALTNSGCTGSGLLSGHTVTCAMTSGSTITNAGSVTNTINTVTIKDSGGTNITANYNVTKANGTLTVNKVVAALSCSTKTYTGAAQTACTYSGCASTSNISGTNAGSYTASCTPDTNHTAPNNITWTMSKKSLTVTAKNQTITYGGAITTGTGQITSSGLISGHTITSVTLAASTTNATTSGKITASAAVVKNSGGTALTDNYSITYAQGTLTINKKDVTVTAASQSRGYNGSALTNSGCTGSGLISGHTVTCAMTSGSTITNAGSVTNTINTVTIKSGSTDVSSNYNVTKATGTLTVTKVVATLSCSTKNYNGSSQTGCSHSGCSSTSNISATNPGTYTASCTPDSNHTAPSNQNWVITGAQCNAGTYLAKSATSCSTCTKNHYCSGGTFGIDSTKDQGIKACKSGYTSSTGQSRCSKWDDCRTGSNTCSYGCSKRWICTKYECQCCAIYSDTCSGWGIYYGTTTNNCCVGSDYVLDSRCDSGYYQEYNCSDCYYGSNTCSGGYWYDP